jgi:hypothetical protein
MRSAGGAVVALAVVGAGVVITNLVGEPSAQTAASPLVIGAPGTGVTGRGAVEQLSPLGAGMPVPSGSGRLAVTSPRAPTTATPTTATTTVAPTTVAPTTVAPTTVAPTTVVVLNNSRITGLARLAAAELAAGAWQVVGIGNLPGYRLPRTTVYYRPGAAAAAGRLAAGQPGGAQVLPAPAWLAGTSTLVLVVTRYRAET